MKKETVTPPKGYVVLTKRPLNIGHKLEGLKALEKDTPQARWDGSTYWNAKVIPVWAWKRYFYALPEGHPALAQFAPNHKPKPEVEEQAKPRS